MIKAKKCPLLINSENFSENEKLDSIVVFLESNDVDKKRIALKKLIAQVIKDTSKLREVLIPVIKFCFSSPERDIKLLCLYFWEVFWTVSDKEHFKDETLLVCNRLLQDLKHPNEYIRSATLRLLCSFQDPQILEMVKQELIQNLEHGEAVCRRFALMALISTEKTGFCVIEEINDALLEKALTESDDACKRNYFVFLKQKNEEMADSFLSKIWQNLDNESDLIQSEIIRFIKNV
ncbi:coatomer subunit beta [Bonamia ostreae]|uniref:Coatomer subunit beta n=1 Tax=Bonamia ostreae TaxID=126728 RepID=A0ABV2AFA4_9EUKA